MCAEEIAPVLINILQMSLLVDIGKLSEDWKTACLLYIPILLNDATELAKVWFFSNLFH